MVSNTIKGLQAIKDLKAQRAAQAEAANQPKANWFGFKNRPDQQTVRFLQEFSEDSPGFKADRGLGFMVVEHVSPTNFKRRATCTLEDEGSCLACEMHKRSQGTEGYKGEWKQKTNLYVNVLVDTPEGPQVQVLSRNANSSFVDLLLQELEDEDTLSDANYRITKSGEGTKTSWSLKRMKGEPLDDSKATVFPDDSIKRDVEYDRQASYYEVVTKAPDTPAREKVEDDDSW